MTREPPSVSARSAPGGGGSPRAWAWLVPSWLFLGWLFQGLLRGEAFFQGDTVLTFYPLKKYLAESLAKGELPEWWPFDSLGQPLTSLPIASVFHPSTLLYLALPFERAWSAQTLCSVLLMPVGAWFLARTLGLRRPSAAFTTLVVSLSFWNVHLAGQTQMHLAAVGLPWFWREGLRVYRGRRGSVVVLALATANLVVGGDPMLLELGALGLLPLLGWRRWRRPRAWLRLVGAGVLGLGLGGVQLVPMVLVFGQSPRSAGLNINTTDMWALRGHHLPELVLPAHYGSALLFDTLYVGLPVLVLALFGLLRAWRFRWPLLLLVLVLSVTAFGRAGPLWQVWSVLLPGWRGFQFPVKTLGPALLPLALLAGRGLQSPDRRWAWPLLGLGGVGLTLAGLSSGLLQVAAGLVGFLLEWRARRLSGRRPTRLLAAVAAAMLGLLGADLALQLRPIETMDFEVLRTPPPLMAALQSTGVSLEEGSYSWSWSKPDDLDARIPDWNQRETALAVLLAAPTSGAIAGLPTTMHYLAGITRRVYDVSRTGPKQEYLWRKQLSHVFGAIAGLQKPPRQPSSNIVATDEALGAVVVRHPDGLPRAYVAFAVTPVPEADQVRRLNEGIRAGDEVLVAPEHRAGLPPLAEPARPYQRVRVTRGVDTIDADVTLDAPGLLVLNEAFARGWDARIDGEAATLIPANHAVMGLPLMPGTHHVSLEYRTPGLGAGLALTAVSAGLLAGWGWARRRRARREPPPGA